MQTHQFPSSLLEQLAPIPEFDREAFLHAHTLPAPVAVRLNPDKKAALDFDLGSAIAWSEHGYYLSLRPAFTLDPLFHAGAYYIQEASSQFIDFIAAQLLEKNTPQRVLDLCAAPGGKSTLLASRLPTSCLLLSNEVIRSRAGILEENITRWGHSNTWVSCNDPRSFGRMGGYFDWILADMPCSGSGMFRKNKKAIDEWNEANVSLCVSRQQRILHDCWDALHAEGYFIYATCSYSPEENEHMLDYIAQHFDVETVSFSVPQVWNIVQTLSPQHGFTGYRFFPDKINGEGFFIAVVKKKSNGEVAYFHQLPEMAPGKIVAQANEFINNSPLQIIPNDRKQFIAIHQQHIADYPLLSSNLYLRKAGINLGEPAQKDWIPEHDIALAIDRNEQLPTIELTKNQALLFLKKETLELSAAKGWYIVTYKNQGLGWVKVLSNRVNNYLPKTWKIRMDISAELED